MKYVFICLFGPPLFSQFGRDLKLASWWAVHATEYSVISEVADCVLKGCDWKNLRDSLPLWLKLPPESFGSAFSHVKRCKPPVLLLSFLLSAQLERGGTILVSYLWDLDNPSWLVSPHAHACGQLTITQHLHAVHVCLCVCVRSDLDIQCFLFTSVRQCANVPCIHACSLAIQTFDYRRIVAFYAKEQPLRQKGPVRLKWKSNYTSF